MFLALAIVIVALWSGSLFGTSTAVVAVALFGSVPAILAHAAGFAFWQWMEGPRWRNGVLLSIATGFGLASKFSFPVFFLFAAVPISFAATRSDRGVRLSGYAQQVVIVLAISMFIVWGMNVLKASSAGRSTRDVNNVVASYADTRTMNSATTRQGTGSKHVFHTAAIPIALAKNSAMVAIVISTKRPPCRRPESFELRATT